MTCTSIAKGLINVSVKALKNSPLIALLLAGMIASSAPARAQANDAWISAAIIGGSTAAGAIIGHRVAGTTGAYVGAAVGGATGYAIDRRRRQSQYNNGYYGDNGGNNGRPYGNNGGYGNNNPPSNNGGYDGGSAYPYPAQYRSDR